MTTEAFCAALDWGSTNLRIRLLDRAGKILDTFESGEGLINLPERDFDAVLEKRLGEMGAEKSLPVVICGMAGSRQGWREVPYLEIPAGLSDIPGAALGIDGASRPVHILPGLSQRNPADVMRGEETQLLGLSLDRDLNGVVCMPGTHSKWVRMQGSRIERFSTFMTGELYALLVKHSLLRFSVNGEAKGLAARPAFATAVQAVTEDPALFGDALFSVRAEGLLNGEDADDATARLSGYCVGLELAGAKRLLGPEGVDVIASGIHAELYLKAFELLGIRCRVHDAAEASRKGLFLAARQIYGTG
jgi:2-dehydro-3-deoxygalactonokinase